MQMLFWTRVIGCILLRLVSIRGEYVAYGPEKINGSTFK
jgi:hypothetical protein